MHDKQSKIHFDHQIYYQINVQLKKNMFDQLIELINVFHMDIYSNISFLNITQVKLGTSEQWTWVVSNIYMKTVLLKIFSKLMKILIITKFISKKEKEKILTMIIVFIYYYQIFL